MKEKELSSADKCRRTKLRKKSVDELVNIILRKDDVERKSSKTIDTYKKLQLTSEKRIETLKDSISKSEEIQSTQEQTISVLNATIDNKNKGIAILEEHNKAIYGRIDYLEKNIVSTPFTEELEREVEKIRFNEERRREYMKTITHEMDIRLEGRDEGLEEGIEIGRAEGLEIGRAEGLEAGQELLLNLIQKMVENGETEEIPRLPTDDKFLKEKLEQYGNR